MPLDDLELFSFGFSYSHAYQSLQPRLNGLTRVARAFPLSPRPPNGAPNIGYPIAQRIPNG